MDSRLCREAAHRVSLTCFMNALCREVPHWSRAPLPHAASLRSEALEAIYLPLSSGQRLCVPLLRFSQSGPHQFEGRAYRLAPGGDWMPIDYLDLVDLVIEDMGKQGDAWDPGSIAAFRSRIADSLNVLGEVFATRGRELEEAQLDSMDFIRAEHHLVVGHSFHPTPKSREGFTPLERRRYGAEYAGSFPLAWFAVDPRSLRRVHAQAFGPRDWVEELIASDPLLAALRAADYPEGFSLMPLHPWQADYLLGQPSIQRLKDKGRLLSLGTFGEAWAPTSSLRSFYRSGSPYMLKTSLHVRLTNSVRTLLAHEVDRGLQVHDVFTSRSGQELLARYPHFHVLYEPAYLCIDDEEGRPIEDSIVVCRSNPFKEKGTVSVLASLTQDHPFGRPSLIEQCLEHVRRDRGVSRTEAALLWWRRYCSVVLEPLLIAQADYGILLGAHQQNILIGLAEGLPESLYFRDCQGTGYSELAYERLKGAVPSLDRSNGNVLDREAAQTLFTYYLMINATFSVAEALARTQAVSEEELLVQLNMWIGSLLEKGLRDPSCLEHFLTSPSLLYKANFLCSLRAVNENTSASPLSLYRPMPNPLYREMSP